MMGNSLAKRMEQQREQSDRKNRVTENRAVKKTEQQGKRSNKENETDREDEN